MNKIVYFAILLVLSATSATAQTTQLCHNPDGNYYYDCSKQSGVQNTVVGNGSSVNNVTVYAQKNSTVVINNQSQQGERTSSANRNNNQLCYNASGNYYFDCRGENRETVSVRTNPNTVRYVPQRQGFVPFNSQPVYPSGYNSATPSGYYQTPQSGYGQMYYGNQPVYYGNQNGYYGRQTPTPYWHDQKSTSVTHDIQTNLGNSGGWWNYGGFNPRNINVNYRVRIQRNKTSVRGSSVNGNVPYVYNTYNW